MSTAVEEFYTKTFYGYQKEFFENSEQFRIVNKARQTGFSTAIAFEMAFNGLRGINSIVGSTGLRASSKLLQQVRSFLLAFEPRLVLETDSKTELKIKKGGHIVSVPANASSIRGFTGDVYLDEVAHIRNAREILQAIGPALTLQGKRKKRLTLLSTPMGKKGLFFDAWTDNNGAFKDYARFNVDIYRAIKEGMKTDVKTCLQLLGVVSENDEAFLTEFGCEFVDELTAFFTFELINYATDFESEYVAFSDLYTYIQSNSGSVFYSGYDPAKKVDGAAFFVIEKKETGEKKVVHKKVWRGEKYGPQLDYIVEVIKMGITSHLTDRTGVGEKLHEDLENKVGETKAQGITYTNNSKAKLIIGLKSDMENGLLTYPDDISLRSELHSLQREFAEGGLTKYHHESGKHDDQVWALANANYIAGNVTVEETSVSTSGYDLREESRKRNW